MRWRRRTASATTIVTAAALDLDGQAILVEFFCPRLDVADTADAEVWTKQWSDTVTFETNRARVVLFDTIAPRLSGFDEPSAFHF